MNPPTDRPRGFGRGLSALIGDEAAAVKGEPAPRKIRARLPVAFLQPGKYQPRKTFDEEPLADLAASIKEKGVLSPILVRPLGADRYEIVAGERRWRAAQMAKLHDVPVVVRELGDDQALEIAIIENVQRADLNAMEEAAAYQELITSSAAPRKRSPRRSARAAPMSPTPFGCCSCPTGQGLDPGRQADGRSCPNTVRRTRSGGPGPRIDGRRADGAPGRTPFGSQEKARWKTAPRTPTSAPGNQYFQWLGAESSDYPQRG